MIRKARRQSKYFAPQNENSKHVCDHPGCNKAGEYRAPKDRNLKEYYWFCLEHVQEYNAKWNYYGGEDFVEEEESLRQKFKFSSHIKYNFGFQISYRENRFCVEEALLGLSLSRSWEKYALFKHKSNYVARNA